MALSKSMALPNGTTVTYWKITGVSINALAKVITCVISGYVDSAARARAPGQPLKDENMTVELSVPTPHDGPGGDLHPLNTTSTAGYNAVMADAAGILHGLYEQAKTLSVFTGATDV